MANLEKSAPSRIISVASSAHNMSPRTYGLSQQRHMMQLPCSSLLSLSHPEPNHHRFHQQRDNLQSIHSVLKKKKKKKQKKKTKTKKNSSAGHCLRRPFFLTLSVFACLLAAKGKKISFCLFLFLFVCLFFFFFVSRWLVKGTVFRKCPTS
jgi:hypothetical protein